METNDLRIGNIIEWNKKPFNVCAIFSTSIENELWSKHISELHPIPLTEEWLVKFGFHYQNKSLYWILLSNLKCELHVENYLRGMVFIIKGDFTELILDPIKYVHQLQNLYFALTNEELTIK